MGEERSAAEILRDLRRQRRVSVRSVASDLGLTPSYVSRLERGERTLGESLGNRFAAYYGVSAEDLNLTEGRLPSDIVRILQGHPELLHELRMRFGHGVERGDSDDRSGEAVE